jgi:hypothetical protein
VIDGTAPDGRLNMRVANDDILTYTFARHAWQNDGYGHFTENEVAWIRSATAQWEAVQRLIRYRVTGGDDA